MKRQQISPPSQKKKSPPTIVSPPNLFSQHNLQTFIGTFSNLLTKYSESFQILNPLQESFRANDAPQDNLKP